MNGIPKIARRRWHWLLVAVCLGGLFLTVSSLRSGPDPRLIGRWTFTPMGSKTPTAQFELLGNGTGNSSNNSSPAPAALRWCTAGDWLFFDDPPPDRLTHLGQSLIRLAVRITGGRVRGADCLKILQVDDGAIQVQSRAGRATLRRIAD